jgi:segregation and condensation protein B
MEQRTMEAMLEGILFMAGEPMEEARLCEAMGVTLEELRHAAQSLGDYYRYHQRGIRLVQLEDSWQLVSAPEYVEEIRHAMERRKPPQLSAPLLEVLGIVAYFQPTTRGYIEQVRGMSSGYSVNTLVERGLIEECGKLSAPGRPTLFRTTKLFLQTFSLTSLDDLPPLPEAPRSEEEAEASEKQEERPEGVSDNQEKAAEVSGNQEENV